MALRLLAILLAWPPAAQESAGRLAEPSPEARKEALAALRTLFKDDYARRAPADQAELARKLLKAAGDPSEEPASRYACLAEARDLAVSCGDVPLAVAALDLLGRTFDVPAPALKLAALAKIAPTLRDPDALRACALAFQALASEAVVAEDYDTASQAATKGETLARAVRQPILSARLAELKKDVVALKGEHQRVKRALDSPAASDADAAGRYLCFVRGDWARGLALLAENGKGSLKALAAKDLASPESADVRIEVADGWWDVGSAERIAWKKAAILARARRWYESALPDASALARVRVEKRLEEIESAVPGPVNLLRLIDPARDASSGDWRIEGGVLTASGMNALRIQVPYQPPEEYDLRVVARRIASTDSLTIGLVVPGSRVGLVVDGHPAKNWITGFEMVDGKFADGHAFASTGRKFILDGKDTVIEVAVRRASVTVSIEGERILAWDGPMTRLGQRADYAMPDAKALSLGSWGGGMGFVDVRLTPLSGPGKRTR